MSRFQACLVVLFTIVVVFVALLTAASSVIDDSSQLSWNAHCARIHEAGSAVERACFDSYTPAMYGK